MSANQTVQQLQQDLQNALTTSNQLMRLIAIELQKIKEFTDPGKELDKNINKNASLMTVLANMRQIDIENAPPQLRRNIDDQPNHNE